MSALDFPASPAVGQMYAPAPLTQPSYVWDGTSWKLLALPTLNPTSGLRNVLNNGSLWIAQRNFQAPGFVGSAWTFDRWQWGSAGTSVTMSAPFAPKGDPNVPGDPRFMMNMVVNSLAGAGNYGLWFNQIENVRQLEGQKCTLSFSVKGDVGKFFGVEIQQYFGTGGSPSAVVYGPPAKLGPCNGAFQRMSYTFDMPSISGKTIGSNTDSYILIVFWLDAGSTYAARASNIGQQSGTWAFAQLQLEKGAYPSYPERRPYGYELWLCQRYYETGTQLQLFPSPNGAGYGHTFGPTFKALKRTTPTMGVSYTSLSAVQTSRYSPNPGPMQDNHWVLGTSFTNISQTYQWTADAA